MRSTMLPPWLRAESHAHRQLNTLPRCMRPEGDGAKRPTTGAGAGASLLLGAVGASTAGVAMSCMLISMRTSIARGEVGEASSMLASCRGRVLCSTGTDSTSRLPPASLAPSTPQTTETPAALRNCRGFRGKGGHDPRANGKGATVFAQLLYAPCWLTQSAHVAATQSRYTCDGAVKWYLSLTQTVPKSVPND